jgi:hypothetical protein
MSYLLDSQGPWLLTPGAVPSYRHIIKLLPFERICYSDVPTVLKEMSELLQPHAQPDNAQDDASGKLPTVCISLFLCPDIPCMAPSHHCSWVMVMAVDGLTKPAQ